MNALERLVTGLGRPAVIAHRGASRRAPENSLAALRLAVELGADGAEFDVQRCGSGELVVFHDRTLARCTGRVAGLRDLSLAELKQLTLDRVDEKVTGSQRGERIPTLDEWLDAAPPGFFLNLEVKSDVLHETEWAADCARALEAGGRRESSVLSSFHPAALVVAAAAAPKLARGTLVEASEGWQARLVAGFVSLPAAVHPEHVLATRARVDAWHRLGRLVAVWTVDAPEQIEACLEAGADAVITNVPDVARPIAERYRR